MRRTSRRHGYVLLMALVMIVLAGFLLAGIARHSLLSAMAALDAQQALQRRWGAISCERAFLFPAKEVFEGFADESGGENAPPPIALPVRLTLGGLTFDLLLADENAKSNLNTVFLKRGKEDVARLCRSVAESGGVLPLELRPGTQDAHAAFQSWGQVFDLSGGSAMSESLAKATGDITCWGNGRLNLRSAMDEQVQAIARLVASNNTVRQLLAIRQQRPRGTLEEWLGALDVSQQDREKLAELLTDESSCFSLWMTINASERAWRTFVVAEPQQQGNRRLSRFVW